MVGGREIPLARFEPTDKPWLSPIANTSGPLSGYYLEGEWLVFLPQPQQGGTLKQLYFGAPGRMTVTATQFRIISSVNPTTGVIGFATWSPAPSGALDIVRGSSGFAALIQDAAYSSAGTTSITLSAADAAFVEVGDYVTVADTTPVVPVPREMYGVLVGRTAAALMRQLGKSSAADMEEANANRLCDLQMALLTPRVESHLAPARGKLMWRRGGGLGLGGWWGR